MENALTIVGIIAGAAGGLAITLALIQVRTVEKFYNLITKKVSVLMRPTKSLDEYMKVLASEQEALLARLDRIESEMRALRNRLVHVAEKESQADASVAQGDLPQALQSYKEAVQIFESLGALERSAEISLKLGEVYDQLGRMDEALQHFRRASEVFRSLGEYQRLAQSIASIAATFQRAGQISNALKYLEEARYTLEKSGAMEAARRIADLIAALQRQRQG